LANPFQSKGRFGNFFGHARITLIKNLSRRTEHIFNNRYWGEPGYIHICFDVYNLKKWMDDYSEVGYPFSVKVLENFQMGKANGRWGYLEDPDGTLIEMVETIKVPIIPALGLNIEFSQKSPHTPLPWWVPHLLKLKKIKR